MVHIDVGPVIGRCDNFRLTNEESPQTKSIVIAPIIITVKPNIEYGDRDRFLIVYACNLAENVKHREK